MADDAVQRLLAIAKQAGRNRIDRVYEVMTTEGPRLLQDDENLTRTDVIAKFAGMATRTYGHQMEIVAAADDAVYTEAKRIANMRGWTDIRGIAYAVAVVWLNDRAERDNVFTSEEE